MVIPTSQECDCSSSPMKAPSTIEPIPAAMITNTILCRCFRNPILNANVPSPTTGSARTRWVISLASII
jgi:hypothetical protein